MDANIMDRFQHFYCSMCGENLRNAILSEDLEICCPKCGKSNGILLVYGGGGGTCEFGTGGKGGKGEIYWH